MDEISHDKLSGAICDFLNAVIHIADEGNYERDDFVKASADVFKIMTDISTFKNFKTKDSLPKVVRCKDCEYSYDEISYLCCSHGVCVDCEVPPNFYCAEGKRKEPDE